MAMASPPTPPPTPSVGIISGCRPLVPAPEPQEDFGRCVLDSGYALANITRLPTTDEISTMCRSPPCLAALAALRATWTRECAVVDGNLFYRDIAEVIDRQCRGGAMSAIAAEPSSAPSSSSSTSEAAPSSSLPDESKTTTIRTGPPDRISTATIVAITMVSTLAMVLIVGFVWMRLRARRSASEKALYSTPLPYVDPDGAAQAVVMHQRPVPPEPSELEIPLTQLEFGTLVSKGGYGQVYRGKYRGHTVAIKCLLPQRQENARLVSAFLDEALLLATLQHPRIVSFFGIAWRSETEICIVSEFVDRGDLYRTIRKFDQNQRPAGFDRTKLKIAVHVAEGLACLHSRHPPLLHRDLKSKNILLTKDYDAKIADFGLSRVCADNTMTAGVGTSLWMAPEVMMGGRYDASADIFSLGVVLSELDSNKKPYHHLMVAGGFKTSQDLLQHVAAGRIRVAPSDVCQPSIASLMLQCVSTTTTQRPTAFEILYRLNQVLGATD